MLTRENVERAIAERKREIAALKRLEGTAVIVEGRTIVTIYRPARAWTRRMLRRADRGRRPDRAA